ncbi:uncharacterized protein LOC129004963 [Macrosteles quadrilineatus]|uniref:uncharacterized protein LOC129004963 n=1 Tax=Macrosteles quadrilineatus TaxID=74068 RepID=UPI0023E22539|nr:uncharacterized protein LOC129004963 [Macrosteles quadrilineatus]
MDARKDYKAAIKDAKLHFNAKIIESSSNKCKTAWSVINSARISSSKAGVVPITADEFNQYFISSVADVQKTVNLNQPASTYLLNNFAVYPRSPSDGSQECDTNNIDSYVYPPVEQFTSDTSYNKKEFSSVKHSNGSLDQFSLKRQDFIKQIPLLPSIVHEQKFSKSYPEEIFRRQRSIKCKHLHKTFKNCLWTLFYTNASLLVLGLILLILALSHFLAKKYISIVTEETGFVIWLWVILILSALIVIVGVYGIITSINPNKCRIVSYCMETFILAFMIIIFLVFLRILFVNIKGVQHSLMSNTLKKYRCIKHIRNAWNELQENFKCCGIEGKEDWKYAPSSCCNATSQQGKTKRRQGDSCQTVQFRTERVWGGHDSGQTVQFRPQGSAFSPGWNVYELQTTPRILPKFGMY